MAAATKNLRCGCGGGQGVVGRDGGGSRGVGCGREPYIGESDATAVVVVGESDVTAVVLVGDSDATAVVLVGESDATAVVVVGESDATASYIK